MDGWNGAAVNAMGYQRQMGGGRFGDSVKIHHAHCWERTTALEDGLSGCDAQTTDSERREREREKGPHVKSTDVPATRTWQSVRNRIYRIDSDLEMIQAELREQRHSDADEVLHRLEGLQKKFEEVMGQLAAFDDDRDESVRHAKEEFRRIVRRYQTSQVKGRTAGVH